MKQKFWSTVRVICTPAKNIWKRAVIEESKLRKEQEQKIILLNKQEKDKQKLMDSMKEFENTMNDLINKLKTEKENVD